MTEQKNISDVPMHGFCDCCHWWFRICKDGTIRSHGYSVRDNHWCPGSHTLPSQIVNRKAERRLQR